MSAGPELHNRLAQSFISDVVAPAIKAGATHTELMVLLESCMTGAMYALVAHYKVRPAKAVLALELAQHRATERLAALCNAEKLA